MNRLTNLTHSLGGTNLLASYSYTLHPTGRRTNAVEVIKTEDAQMPWITNTFAWQFDGMYRLTNEVCLTSVSGGSYTNAYEFDKVGNRLKKVRVTAANTTTITNLFDANDQLLKEVTLVGGALVETNAYAYDLNGSLVAKTNISASTTVTLCGYNLANKLSSVSTQGSGLTNFYTYNDQGIRVRKDSSAGGNPTLYLVDASNHTGYAQVLEELNALGGTPIRSYVIGDDILAQAGSQAQYLLYDGHGSTRQVASNAGVVTSRYNYDAYGLSGPGSTSQVETSLLYCGEQYDSTLGMYNLRARFYDPSNGRFTTRDTFEGDSFDPQSLHKYAFCQHDPINGLDPTGLSLSMEQVVTMSIMFFGVASNASNLGRHWGTRDYAAIPWDVLGIVLSIAGAGGGGTGLTLAPASGGAMVGFAANFAKGARMSALGGAAVGISGLDLIRLSNRLTPSGDKSALPEEGPYPNKYPDKLAEELTRVDRLGVEPAQAGTSEFWQMLRENPVVKWAVTKDGKLGIVPYRVNGREIPHTAITRGSDAWAGEASLKGDTLWLNMRSGHYQPRYYSKGQIAFEGTGLKVKFVDEPLVRSP